MGGDFLRGYMAGLQRAIQELNHDPPHRHVQCSCGDAESRIRFQFVKCQEKFQISQEASEKPAQEGTNAAPE